MRHEGCRVLGRSTDLQYYRQPEEIKSVRSKDRMAAGLISLLHWSRQDTVKEKKYIARDESVTLGGHNQVAKLAHLMPAWHRAPDVPD